MEEENKIDVIEGQEQDSNMIELDYDTLKANLVRLLAWGFVFAMIAIVAYFFLRGV